MKKKRNYINNPDMLEAIIKYKQAIYKAEAENKSKPRIPDYLGECFYKIATNYVTKPRFSRYTYRDEMVSDAVLNCIRYCENFDEKNFSNPFAYFTQYCHNAFFRRINEERKENALKAKHYIHLETTSGFDPEIVKLAKNKGSEAMNHTIKEYEESLLTKKKKKDSMGIDAFLPESKDEK